MAIIDLLRLQYPSLRRAMRLPGGGEQRILPLLLSLDCTLRTPGFRVSRDDEEMEAILGQLHMVADRLEHWGPREIERDAVQLRETIAEVVRRNELFK